MHLSIKTELSLPPRKEGRGQEYCYSGRIKYLKKKNQIIDFTFIGHLIRNEDYEKCLLTKSEVAV